MRHPPIRLLILPGLLLSAACADRGASAYRVDPNRVRFVEPLQPPPLEPGDPATQPTATRPASREVSLDDLRLRALQGNLDLQALRFDPRVASLRLDEERAAFDAILVANVQYASLDAPVPVATAGSRVETFRFVPGIVVPVQATGGQVRADVDASRTETNNPFALLNPAYSADGRLTLTQPLARGFGADAVGFGIRVASTQLGQTQARLKFEVVSTLAATDRAYWLLYAARQADQVRRQQVQLAQQQLERARRLVAAGVQPEVEVLRAQANVADAEELLLQAGNLVRERQRNLKRLVNDPELPVDGPTDLRTTTLPEPALFRVDAPRLAEAALEKRMDLLEIELRLLEQNAAILAARNARLPLVNLQYQYATSGLGGSYGDAFSEAAGFDFQNHSVGLEVQIPVGNRVARLRLRQAMLRRLQQLSVRESRVQIIRLEVFDAADRLETAWQRILAARRRVSLSGRLLDAEVRQFELGLRTGTEVLEAQTTLAAAQLAEIEALTAYEVARVDLAFVTGTTIGSSRVRVE